MAASKTHSGVHKHHGPKKHMFHCWSRSERIMLQTATYEVRNKEQPNKNEIKTHFVKVNLLSKYNNQESWLRALAARGKVRIPNLSRLWYEYINLPTVTEKNKWLKGIKDRDLYKEEEEYRKSESLRKQVKELGGKKPIKEKVEEKSHE